ncbi:unnamed protein product [Prorocentrum cordatum]|uniref:Uncharacterized protein n=1 Tax=Prorocentrum cordatum TaxID=2364126 RepID=A0ABN9V4J6_9DINO|nr:unnamed protein product [Polarella glacialis]
MLYMYTSCFRCACGGKFKKLRAVSNPEVEGSLSKFASAALRFLSEGVHPKLVAVTFEVFESDEFEIVLELRSVAASLRCEGASSSAAQVTSAVVESGSD